MADTMENQYLTFGIDGDTFGVPVSKVREVLEYSKPTKLPRTADFLKGLINIILDMDRAFNDDETQKLESVAENQTVS